MAAFEKAVKNKWADAVLTSGTFNEVSCEIVKIEKSGTTDGGFSEQDACNITYGIITITPFFGSVKEYEDDSTINWYNRYDMVKIECGDLKSLTDGTQMFQKSRYLTTFTSDMSNLTNGMQMFWNCPSLTTVASNMNMLEYGMSMFGGCESLTSFTSDMPRLGNCDGMFDGCTSLTTFESDLSNLNICHRMFENCSSLQSVKIKCTANNKSLMTKSSLSIRSEATLEVSTDGGATWETINN